MLNISEIVDYFIKISYTEELQKNIYTSFTLLEMFDVSYYEDKYLDLISRSETIDTDSKRDSFIVLLKKDILDIITEHKIQLNLDMDLSLDEVNEVAHFLYIIQNLEDYLIVDYIINSENSNRKKVCELLSKYSLLNISRILDIVDEVDDTFIEAMKQYIKYKEPEDDTVLDRKHIDYVKTFFSFIENSDCLGKRLYESGYTNLTLNELTNIVTFNLAEYIDSRVISNPSQTALDALSLLIITKDNYTLPLFKFEQNTSLFTTKLETVTKLNNIMTNMLNDYNNYYNAVKQKEKLNDD